MAVELFEMSTAVEWDPVLRKWLFQFDTGGLFKPRSSPVAINQPL